MLAADEPRVDWQCRYTRSGWFGPLLIRDMTLTTTTIPTSATLPHATSG
jgi:hypothetical protein